ncbi:hypothetical protein MMPV_006462 [Pyropia vietnamensis]
MRLNRSVSNAGDAYGSGGDSGGGGGGSTGGAGSGAGSSSSSSSNNSGAAADAAAAADGGAEAVETPWLTALESLFVAALESYYAGTPLLSDREFSTLRDELEHLGSSCVRLNSMEKMWVRAAQQRDFDRTFRAEFELTEDELRMLKTKLLEKRQRDALLSAGGATTAAANPDVGQATPNGVRHPDDVDSSVPRCETSAKIVHAVCSAVREALPSDYGPPAGPVKFAVEADPVDAQAGVDERLRFLLFGEATEERFKIALLYLPAAMMSIVAGSVLSLLFFLFDGEVVVTITDSGRFRLGVLSYLVVVGTVWFTNKITPQILAYLDLGQPTLLKGACPNCSGPVSCLFTSNVARRRDERRCPRCGATIGFNAQWSTVYLVSPPGSGNYSSPD